MKSPLIKMTVFEYDRLVARFGKKMRGFPLVYADDRPPWPLPFDDRLTIVNEGGALFLVFAGPKI